MSIFFCKFAAVFLCAIACAGIVKMQIRKHIVAVALLASVMVRAEDAKLTGTVMGSSPSVEYVNFNATTTQNLPKDAFDGDMNTYYASYNRSNTWVGLDLGERYVVTKVGWSPRNDGQGEKRVQLAVFEGANRPDFMDAMPLYVNDKKGTIGKMDYADEYGNLTGGTFGARDILIDVMYARQLGPMFKVGVTLKPVYSIYESYSSFALGADVGAHFQLPDSTFSMGLVLQNIGWQLKGFYSAEDGTPHEMLPLNLQLGLSYRVKHAPLRFHLQIHNMQTWYLNYEWTSFDKSPTTGDVIPHNIPWYDMLFRHTIWSIEVVDKRERFYIALSYNHRRRAELQLTDQKSLAGFALGAGVKIKQARLGFAISQMTKSNFSYQLGLTLDINSLLK